MVAANGIYKLAVIGTVHGQQHVHTLHFRSTAAPTALAASEETYQSDLLAAWQTAARTPWRALHFNFNKPCQQYQVRKVCGTIPLPAGLDAAETPPNDTGTGVPTAAEWVASWLCHVVTLRTPFSGRRYRGRNFIGGMQEDQVSGDTISTSRLTLTTTYYEALRTAFITPDDLTKIASLFVFSRKQAAVGGTQCHQAGGDVRSYQVRNNLATMKSRKFGSGI